MYIRSEKRTWKILGTHLKKGEVMPITAEQLKELKAMIGSGDLVVLDDHPDQKKKAASRRRSRTNAKQRGLASKKSKDAGSDNNG